MSALTTDQLIQKIRQKGYKVFEGIGQLNMVGIRKAHARAGCFDDELHVFSKVSSTQWVHHTCNITTDPGTYWHQKKGKPQQTLMLAEGQYTNAFANVESKTKLAALKQINPVLAYPAYDRKALLDLFQGNAEKGMYRIQLMCAKSNGKYLYLTRDMGGCQVVQYKDDYFKLINMWKGHLAKYGNFFTYTLLDERIYHRKVRKNIAFIAGVFMTILYSFTGNKTNRSYERK